jgi:hypothetical protein
VADWRTRDLSFALHLGDILDGFCPKARADGAQRRGSKRARACARGARGAQRTRLKRNQRAARRHPLPRAQDASEAALRCVLDEFDALQRPVWHCLGNHCLYNLPRPTLNARLWCVVLRLPFPSALPRAPTPAAAARLPPFPCPASPPATRGSRTTPSARTRAFAW